MFINPEFRTINPLTQIDAYKSGHVFQYPPKTEQVYSNFTPRSSFHAPVLDHFDEKIVWFGLQGFIKHFLIDAWNRGFFYRRKENVVAEYQRRLDAALGKGAVPVDHIAALHDLGYLPLQIKSLPEGSRVNMRVPTMTIVNTLPEFFWLTNYIETVTSNELWKPSTVATIAFEYRKMFEVFAETTGSPKSFVDWQGHDFSCRGMSGLHDAMMCGAGHLLSFYGSDTIAAIDYLEQYYNADCTQELIGGSVPATEHSVISMGGHMDELATFRRLITEVYPSGIVSLVSDTWDFFKVVTEYAETLKPEILARTPDALGNCKVVFRPDSGDPADILCGTANVIFYDHEDVTFELARDCFAEYLYDAAGDGVEHGRRGPGEVSGHFRHGGQTYKMILEVEWNRHDKQYYYLDGSTIKSCEPSTLTPQERGAVECLWDVFGGTRTENGFKMLDSHIGLIYGDSITLEIAYDILTRLMNKGFAASNVVFGIGSFTYQYVTRDSFGWAMKATAGVVDGVARTLFKNPATDSGVKRSAVGYLRVEEEGENFVLYDNQTFEQSQGGALKTVFLNGELIRETSLSEIRALLLK